MAYRHQARAGEVLRIGDVIVQVQSKATLRFTLPPGRRVEVLSPTDPANPFVPVLSPTTPRGLRRELAAEAAAMAEPPSPRISIPVPDDSNPY